MNASDSSSLNESDKHTPPFSLRTDTQCCVPLRGPENLPIPTLCCTDASLQSRSGIVPKIKHIVLSGGGGTGLAYYGALRESHKDGFWNISDIETMHGVSCGSLFIFIIAMHNHISWEDYDDYLIKRPWETVCGFSPDKLLNAFNNIGICDRETIELTIAPILRAVDLSLNITLQELYDFTNIELHFHTTNLDTYKLVDLSYKTHPDWTVVDAIYSSSALPLLFRPNRMNGEVYADGGFLCNYPLQQCIDQVENQDEIFGLNKTHLTDTTVLENEDLNNHASTKEYKNITEYLLDIITKTVKKLIVEKTHSKYTMDICDTKTSVWEVYEALKTKETRAAKIQYGAQKWEEFKTKIGFVPEPH